MGIIDNRGPVRAYGVITDFKNTDENGYVSSNHWEKVFPTMTEFKKFLAEPAGDILVNGYDIIEED